MSSFRITNMSTSDYDLNLQTPLKRIVGETNGIIDVFTPEESRSSIRSPVNSPTFNSTTTPQVFTPVFSLLPVQDEDDMNLLCYTACFASDAAIETPWLVDPNSIPAGESLTYTDGYTGRVITIESSNTKKRRTYSSFSQGHTCAAPTPQTKRRN